MTSKDNQPKQAEELHQRAEEIARDKAPLSPESYEAQSPEAVRQALHELRVHQIELGLQNEELRQAQLGLGVSRARYFDLYEIAPVGYCTVSEKGLILETNLTAATLLGMTRGELVKQPLSRFILQEDHGLYYLHRKQLFEGGEPQMCELRMVKSDGTLFWGNLEATAAQDADGTPICRVVMSNITKRKQAEEALREERWRLQSIIDGTRSGTWEWNVQTGETVFNETWAQIIGYTLDELAPINIKTWELFVHPDDLEQSGKLLERHFAGELPYYDCECRMKHKDGHWVWIHDRGRVITRTGDGKPLMMFGTHTDVTERKHSEEKFNLHMAIMETVAEGIFLIGLEDNIIKWTSSKFEKLFGYGPGEMVGMHVDKVNAPTEKSPTETRVSIVDILQQGGEWHGEIKNIKKNGTHFWCYIHVSLFNHPEFGTVMVSAHTDITERKQAEEENAKLEAQLQQAQKMESVGRLAGGVAHDFNNMLGIILGHAELALNRMDPALPLFADLQEIQKAARRSADLTRQLLAFARKQTVAPKVLDLNETVESMLKMLRRLIGEDIGLSWLPGKNLWPVKVDPSQIDQILANLCVNARDAIAGVGKVTIETKDSTFDEAYCAEHAGFVPGDYVRLTVSDDGCGMDKETIANIFEPFFTTKGVGEGTGLGLSTVYGIVKQNKGFISIDSEPGKGTSFKIYIPRHAGQAVEDRKADAAEISKSRGETVLLVEDEQAILYMATRMLEVLGYTVLAANTSDEAIRQAEVHVGDIHLLMTDVVMPEMNGRDLAQNLLSRYPRLKSLFMSGYTANVIAHHGVLDEGVSFIQKPFSLKDLAAKIRQALDR
jgi:two-component system cell cycle sensor histidine kinase/response regulator CckA